MIDYKDFWKGEPQYVGYTDRKVVDHQGQPWGFSLRFPGIFCARPFRMRDVIIEIRTNPDNSMFATVEVRRNGNPNPPVRTLRLNARNHLRFRWLLHRQGLLSYLELAATP